MGSDQKRDADMDRLLRAVLNPASQPSAGTCPDPGVLAAFVEGSLTANEQGALDAHIVECSRCQETLAVLSRDLPAQEAQPVGQPDTGWFTWVTRPRLRWLVPISAAATVAVVFFATRPLIAPEGEVPGAEVARMAQAPAPPAVAPESEADSLRARPAETTAQNELAASGRQQAARSPAMEPSAPTGAPRTLADVQEPAAERARDKRAAEPAAEMMAARVASEEKRAQATAPAAVPPAPAPPAAKAGAAPPPPAGGQAAVAPVQEDAVRKEAAGKDRMAGVAGAPVAGGPPAKLVRSVAAGVVTVREPGGTVLWRLGAGGLVTRSSDGGASWQPQASGVTADLLAGSALSPDVCWVVGAFGTVLLTTDGRQWQRRPFPEQVDLVAVMARDARSATVTTRDGRRLETLDAGATWFHRQ